MPLLEERSRSGFGIPFGLYDDVGRCRVHFRFRLTLDTVVRRLSAFALFALMFAAVYPFGRVDMIGHATILASLLIVVADPQRANALRLRLKAVLPPSWYPRLAAALAITMISYAGLHNVIYDRASGELQRCYELKHGSAKTSEPPRRVLARKRAYHGDAGTSSAPGAGAAAAMMEQMNAMHEATSRVSVQASKPRLRCPDGAAPPGRDRHGTYLSRKRKRSKLRQLAEHIIADQEAEIAQMKAMFLRKPPLCPRIIDADDSATW